MAYIFMGSCPFSLSALEILGQKIDFRAVLTAPPKAKGRGQKVQITCVHAYAETQGWPVFTPQTFRDPEALAHLASLEPRVIIVASYGLILPKAVLDIPTKGCVNIHPSLLPRWRGASPVTFSLLEGDGLTGVSLMLMDPGVDTGPLLYQEVIPMPERITAPELSHLLAQKAARALLAILPAYEEGSLQPVAQPKDGATLTRKLTKNDGHLDPRLSAFILERKVRALQPWPGTWMDLEDPHVRIGILSARAIDTPHSLAPGRLSSTDQGALILCGDQTALLLDKVRAPSGKIMEGWHFLNGLQANLRPA